MLGINAGNAQAASDILDRIAHEVNGRHQSSQLCGVQDSRRKKAHGHANAAAHAQKGRDEDRSRFSRQPPKGHDRGTDDANEVQETGDIENANDDKSHDDIGSRLVVPIVKPLRTPSMNKSRTFFFCFVSDATICFPSIRIFLIEHLQINAHEIAADDFEHEHDDERNDDGCHDKAEYSGPR